ncbi:DUF4142 domain-containing protein [Cryptosporangium phraense]|uniref:DUF4142 domain-containing protein n=1 Tax=Cryptosporangium phraense TaxID=2593070 RepID=A0A545AZL8_9ACTN|nr:DUF4142 domain-containing protein [Cryptosporangium phraense]TQS46783.1 DUF4142 domain-containing protein [Cryptosporangium phraense]
MRTLAALIIVGLLATTPTQPNAQDRLFLRTAHQGNLAEISAARIAQQRAGTSTVRDLAARWIDDHTFADQALTQAAIALDVVLPATPTPEQEALAERYRTATADEFDRLWVSTQVTEHQRATSLATAELTAGASETVKALARAARPMVSDHLRRLADAEPAVGAAVPAEPDVPRPGSVPAVSTAPSPGWRVEEPAGGTPGWTQPRPSATGIPVPGGPWPSVTPAP